MLLVDNQYINNFISEQEIDSHRKKSEVANKLLTTFSGKGNDFLGWLNLPSEITQNHLDAILKCAEKITTNIDTLVVIGIGGSYLGAKSVIEALSNPFGTLSPNKRPQIIFAGHHIDEDYHFNLLKFLVGKSVACIVISKSGTTTEPAIAFRLIKNHIEQEYGKAEAKNRIVAITDKKRGALKKMADLEGYETFVIEDNIGGRFSVLSPVGLLPIACAGYDIKALVQGAVEMLKKTGVDVPYEENPALQYATLRNAIYGKGKKIELLSNYNPRLQYFGEWWKQLFGESEGKEHKGIFNASVNFTTDLHSMGQYIQDGERSLFETVISVENPDQKLTIPEDKNNFDDLNYLANKRMSAVNAMAELGTNLAHNDGGVPIIRIKIDRLIEKTLGEMIYFFERACGISGYMLGVNPFDQEGVEAYKKNMFALLEKPGFEEVTRKIKEKLKS